LEGSDVVQLLLGIIIGTGCGLLLARYLQIEIVTKYKEELVDWIVSEESMT
jgi:hypothetical protein